MHFHTERNHQGKDNVLLFPVAMEAGKREEGSVNCKERLGGLLNITIGKLHEFDGYKADEVLNLLLEDYG